MKRAFIKGIWLFGCVGLLSFAKAATLSLEGIDSETLTTGDLLDGVRNSGLTTNVVEIGGLKISARSGGTNQQLNATSDSFGINTDDVPDDTDALDAGERLIFSFDQTVNITRIDFNQFTAGESIWMVVGENEKEIQDLELSNRNRDYLDTNLVVAADTEIQFYTTGDNSIGLDGLDLTLLEEAPPQLSLSSTNGQMTLSVHFNSENSSSYILQYCSTLSASNAWTTISSTFSSNVTWQVEKTESGGFYRVIKAE